MGNERHNTRIGHVYRMGKDCIHRCGSGWYRGRLKEGDLLLCVGHSGDCFSDYLLIEEISYADRLALRRVLSERIGAYDFGTVAYRLDFDQFHRLAGGVEIDAPK